MRLKLTDKHDATCHLKSLPLGAGLVVNSGTRRVLGFVKKQLGNFACIFISMKTDEEGDGAFGGGVCLF